MKVQIPCKGSSLIIWAPTLEKLMEMFMARKLSRKPIEELIKGERYAFVDPVDF